MDAVLTLEPEGTEINFKILSQDKTPLSGWPSVSKSNRFKLHMAVFSSSLVAKDTSSSQGASKTADLLFAMSEVARSNFEMRNSSRFSYTSHTYFRRSSFGPAKGMMGFVTSKGFHFVFE